MNAVLATPRTEAERRLDSGAIRQLPSTLADQRNRQAAQPLGGPIDAISAKPDVEPQGKRRPPGQRFEAPSFLAQIPARIAKSIERLDIVVAGEAGGGVAQGEGDHEGSLDFPSAIHELPDGRQQAVPDPQAREYRRQGCCAGKV